MTFRLTEKADKRLKSQRFNRSQRFYRSLRCSPCRYLHGSHLIILQLDLACQIHLFWLLFWLLPAHLPFYPPFCLFVCLLSCFIPFLLPLFKCDSHLIILLLDLACQIHLFWLLFWLLPAHLPFCSPFCLFVCLPSCFILFLLPLFECLLCSLHLNLFWC